MKRALLFVGMAMAILAGGAAEAKEAGRGAAAGMLGGAVIGQAVGHDTHATLLGAALGGVVGYMVGNEMEKSAWRSSGPTPDHNEGRNLQKARSLHHPAPFPRVVRDRYLPLPPPPVRVIIAPPAPPHRHHDRWHPRSDWRSNHRPERCWKEHNRRRVFY